MRAPSFLIAMLAASIAAAQPSFDARDFSGHWDRSSSLESFANTPGGTRGNLATAQELTEWVKVREAQQLLLADAQTSGGLLLCVSPRWLEAVLARLRERRAGCAAVIGRVVRSARPRIIVSL